MPSAVETAIRTVVGRAAMRFGEFNRQRMKPLDLPHPFLTGLYAPVAEEKTLTRLQVSGTIPAELDGRYIRIGPNPLQAPHLPSYHWFVGDGMVHGIRLKQGRALWYRNRWIRSEPVSRALHEQPLPGPRHGNLQTVNTNVIGHAGQTWAVVEAGSFPVKLDEALNSVAHDPFGGSLTGSFSAHPHRDPDTEELHAVCYEADNPNEVRHVVVDPRGRVRREEPIPVKHGPMIHDCMITKRFVLVFDMPVTLSMRRLLRGYTFPYGWNPKHGARVGLMPREGTADDIIWCGVDPCALFHPCNGYDLDDGRVVVDLCVHGEQFENTALGPEAASLKFERWSIDPATRRVERKVLDESPQEFPRLNELRIGKPYRYAYTLAQRDEDALVEHHTCLYKHDLRHGVRSVHDFGADRFPGEFVFVPRRDASEEDAGWLMGFVADNRCEATDFVILDAQNFAGPEIASVRIDARIPNGFHGNWIASPVSGEV